MRGETVTSPLNYANACDVKDAFIKGKSGMISAKIRTDSESGLARFLTALGLFFKLKKKLFFLRVPGWHVLPRENIFVLSRFSNSTKNLIFRSFLTNTKKRDPTRQAIRAMFEVLNCWFDFEQHKSVINHVLEASQNNVT